MARLIPCTDLGRISNRPERDTAEALLAQLPDNVIVYHSYPWLRAERNDRTGQTTIKEGETVFRR